MKKPPLSRGGKADQSPLLRSQEGDLPEHVAAVGLGGLGDECKITRMPVGPAVIQRCANFPAASEVTGAPPPEQLGGGL